jgi:hypothetical protein
VKRATKVAANYTGVKMKTIKNVREQNKVRNEKFPDELLSIVWIKISTITVMFINDLR